MDPTTYAYGEEKQYYHGGLKDSNLPVKIQTGDRITVKVDLQSGLIDFFNNNTHVYRAKIEDPSLTYYPVVFTNCGLAQVSFI